MLTTLSRALVIALLGTAASTAVTPLPATGTMQQENGAVFEIEVVVAPVDPAALPRIGQQMDPPVKPVFVARGTCTMDGSAQISALHERQYLAGWQPIVGHTVVGYLPLVDLRHEGVEFAATLSESSTPGAPRAPARVRLEMTGAVSRVTLRTFETEGVPAMELPSTFTLPVTAVLDMPLGSGSPGGDRLTVVAAIAIATDGAWWVGARIARVDR